MNCKKCGAPLMEYDKFCKVCGCEVIRDVTQPVNNGVINNTPINNPVNNFAEPIENSPINNPANNFAEPTGNSPINNLVNNFAEPIGNSPINNPVNNFVGSSGVTPENKSQKNKNLMFILIGIGVLFVILIIVLILSLTAKEKVVQKPVENNSEEINNVSKTSNYTVKFKGFTFKIPTNLIYETQEEAILLGDENGTWSTYIEVISGSYNQVFAKKNQLTSIYQSSGYSASIPKETNVEGVQYITLEISKNGRNALLGMAKANSMYIFGLTMYTIDNEYDYDILKTMSGILSSSEFNNETNSISTFEKVDMSKISEIAK